MVRGCKIMTDEEKKVIEYTKEEYKKGKEQDNVLFPIYLYQAEIIINLIEKQQKEIEELKNGQIDFWISDKEIEERIRNKFVSKDKIKAILGIEENIDEEKILSLLQTIVDENARLEDIEDRKVQIEYNNVFNKGVKSVEDKIKAKIEPKLKELDEQMKKEWKEYGNSREYQDMEDMYNFLQSLLEKE